MTAVKIVLAIILLPLFMYGSYWIAKTVSYKIFYKDMVTSTITETIKSNCLK